MWKEKRLQGSILTERNLLLCSLQILCSSQLSNYPLGFPLGYPWEEMLSGAVKGGMEGISPPFPSQTPWL